MKLPRPVILLLPLAAVLVLVWLWLGQQEGPARELAGNDGADQVMAPQFKAYDPGSAVTGPESLEVPLPSPDKNAIPGEFTLIFKDAESMEAFLESAEAAGIKILGTLSQLNAVRFSASRATLRDLLTDDMSLGYNYPVDVPAFPDLNFWQSNDLSAFGQEVLSYLGAPGFGERVSWGNGVTVAVLDTGWLGHTAVLPQNVRQISLLEDPAAGDFSGHGTAVAGLITSTNAFAPGLAPGSEILAVQVLDGNGQGDAFTLAAGVIAAVENGADVINMSLGSYGDSEILRQAVAYAASQGVVLIAASGNDGQSFVTYPAAYPEVIGVAAIDAEGNRAPFSNYGEGIDLAAPGYRVNALWEENEFIYFDGTSASAPLVAAMAARIIESNPGLSAEEVRGILIDNANETGYPGVDIQYGAGILNAERIESSGQSGIIDMALADLYPAVEQSEGGTFPLYISLENRGTTYIPGATVELTVNGKPYFYRFSGMESGGIESIQLPVPEALLESGQSYNVSAKVTLPESISDSRPANNDGEITLSKAPDG